MKIKPLLLIVFLCNTTIEVYSQTDQHGSTEEYIKHAVPPFDNRTKKLDLTKLERKPINLYKPALQKQENNMNRSVFVVSDNTDIQVFPSVNAQSEQHMKVSKINPDNIILGSNTPFYQGFYVSQDGGATWFGSDKMPDSLQSYGDPTTAFNSDGDIFFETMMVGTTGYKVFSSIDQGTNWSAPVLSTYTTSNFDKEMMAIDNLPGSPYLDQIYTAWTDFASPRTVRFNRSVNGGTSYQPEIILHTSWGQGTNVQTGVNGEVYVCWANYTTDSYPADAIGFSVSTNGGSSFTDLTPVFTYTGIRVAGSNPIFNNTRVNDFPTMAVDKSCSASRGRIYIAYPAKQNGNGKSVIYVRYSDNQGTSWSSQTEVSISAGRQNWFPSVAVDDATGTVSVSYLTYDLPSGFTTNTYLAYSFDGGLAWDNIKVSDVGHTVAAIPGFAVGYCGDYIANTSWANKNYIAWNDDRTGQWQNYVSRIDFNQPGVFSSDADFNINGPLVYDLPTATDLSYQAVANIHSPIGSSMVIQPGASVAFVAGGHIILHPGFIAGAGSHFHAQIGSVSPCVNAVQRDDVAADIKHSIGNLKPAYTGDATVQFSIFPNPAVNHITFEYLLTQTSDVTLTLMDVNGKNAKVLMSQVSQEAGLNQFNADISSYSNGTYLFSLKTIDYVKTGKFVKTD